MGNYAVLAEALRYPWPGQVEILERYLEMMPAGPSRRSLAAFVAYARDVSLAEREELYTRTWDLNPVAAPYLGFQVWGEKYQRGNFMAQLSQVLRENGIDMGGELPDHLVPVLKYLDRVEQPTPALESILAQAIQAMVQNFRDKSEGGNPYLHLLKAILDLRGDR